MRILLGVDGSPEALSGVRLIATLPLSASDEIVMASVADRPMLIGAWGYAATDLTGSPTTRRGALQRQTLAWRCPFED